MDHHVWQMGPSRWALTVVAKITYRLEPGVLTLADAQEPLHPADVRWENKPDRSVYAPADHLPFKRRAEVMLVGNVYARGGRPTRSLVARVCVGRVDKSIEVRATPVRGPGAEMLEGKPFTKMALHYERAAGGLHTENPVGVSPSAVGDRAPNLVPLGFPLSAAHAPPPIGFGPIARDWPTRVEKVEHLPSEFNPLMTPLDSRFDASFFQSAPSDQQLETIRPNERITLENVHPKHPRLVAHLPGDRLRAHVQLDDGELKDILLAVDTLWIDTRRLICTATHRAHVEIAHADQLGEIWVERCDAQVEPDVGRSSIAPPLSVPPPAVYPPAPPRLVQPAVAPQPIFAEPAAAPLGAFEASNAAAAVVVEAPARSNDLPMRATRGSSSGPTVETVWVDDTADARIASRSEWTASPLGDATGRGGVRISARVYHALSRGPFESPTTLEAWIDKAEKAVSPEPPVVAIAGNLELALDELEMLKATITGAAPLAESDPKLAEVLSLATTISSESMHAPAEVMEGYTQAVREAWSKVNRLLPADHLVACTERFLLEQRLYQVREFGGETWIRALVSNPAWEGSLVVYLPNHLKKRLPLFRRFTARILGELVWQQDQFEVYPFAIIPLAVGRIPVRASSRSRRISTATAG
ncbi:MAG: DUF2169 domain-containing protein [Polyangiaceae bacterium]|nr:DUF2169 domain-containing protein [Polyangiaceae bacterium]